MRNLDWDKITNDKDFQRLVNHLFAVECNSPGFIPSSSYIAADGGWDGFYEGLYPFENLSGIWSIQSKYTTQSGTSAVTHLKTEIKKELRKAQRNGVDHLRIATNAKLGKNEVDKVRDLESLNKGEVKTLGIWHRENLTIRIERQPFVRYHFFDYPQYPVFVPWDIYFKNEKFLIDIPKGKSIKFSTELNHVKNFVLGDRSNILIIHAPGGYGKSHLLREIARNIHPVDRERQCWLTRLGFKNIKDALQEEIANISGRKYLFVLDDADRHLKDAKPLISFAKSQGESVKVILGTRTAGLDLIRYIIRVLRCGEFVAEMSISKWSREELTNLLRIASKKEKVDDEELIVNLHPNPFILVWIGKHIKGEETIDIHKLKEKMIGSIEYDTEISLADYSLSRREIDEFLLNLSCVIPCFRNDSKIIEILSKSLGLEDRKVKACINKLLEVEVLREVGKSLRFNPDMIGDLYLAFKLENLGEIEVNDLIERWMGICPEKVFANLASAPKYGDLKQVRIILGKLIRSWIGEADKTTNDVRTKRLSLISEITHFVPEEALDLIYSYLETKALPSQEPIIKALNVDIEPDLDDYGPAIKNLMDIPRFNKKIALLIKYLYKKGSKGTYDNYKPRRLIRELVSPIHRNPTFIKGVFEKLYSWLNDSDIGIAEGELIFEAISEVLAGSHQYSHSLPGKYVLGERILRDSSVAHELRDIALDLLKQLLLHSKLEISVLGIKGVRNIGETWMRHAPEKDLPLAERIAKDREEIIEVIEKLIRPDTDFPLLNEIENLLITWWAQDTPGTKKAAELLRIFPHSPEYIVYRYFVSPDDVIEDFISVEKKSPKGDKWEWFVDNFMHKGLDLKAEGFKPLVEKLNKKYKSPKEITDFIIFLEHKISPYNPWTHPLLITCWFQINSDSFLSIRGNDKLWHKISSRFQKEIEIVISRSDKEHVKKVAQEVLAKLPHVSVDKVETLMRLIEETSIPQDEYIPWLLDLFNIGTSEIRSEVVFHLYFLFEKSKDTDTLTQLLNLSVSLEKTLTSTTIRNLCLTLHRIKKWPMRESKITVDFRERLFTLLKDVSHIDHEVGELLDFSCNNIDCIIDFIGYRLNKSLLVRKSGGKREDFEAIPYGGLECIRDKILSLESFEKLMEKVIYWYKQEPLWRIFDLECLMEPLMSLEYAYDYIKEQIHKKNIENALIISSFLRFSNGTYPIFLEVFQKAFESGFSKKAKGVFVSVVHSGGWGAKPGEPPPALVSKKEILQKMYNETTPGPLRSFIKDFVSDIERQIKNHLLEDEEFLNPKI